jgi:hypothetical protein
MVLEPSKIARASDFAAREETTARSFAAALRPTSCQRIVYLGGLIDESRPLSPHLRSRQRASIIVGSGSASFEIVRDLAEKLPVMVCPRWVNTRCQPIAIRNVIDYLTGVIRAVGASSGENFTVMKVTPFD